MMCSQTSRIGVRIEEGVDLCLFFRCNIVMLALLYFPEGQRNIYLISIKQFTQHSL